MYHVPYEQAVKITAFLLCNPKLKAIKLIMMKPIRITGTKQNQAKTRIITSGNPPQFGKSSIERHLAALKSLPNAGTGPRLLAPHSKPTAAPLTGRMPSSLSLGLLPGPRLGTQVIETKSSILDASRRFLDGRRSGIQYKKWLS